MYKEVADVEDVFALKPEEDAGGNNDLPVVVNCSGRSSAEEKGVCYER